MLGWKKGGVGYVLVKTDSVVDNVADDTGLDNRPILTDTTYNRQMRMRIWGEVIQTPVTMGGVIVSTIPNGYPAYGPSRVFKDDDMDEPSPSLYTIGGVNKYKFMSDIEPEVEIGDKLYFKWRVYYTKNNFVAQSGDGKMFVYKVPYDHIYCAVRNGVIIPIGSHVLIEPELEKLEDILEPTYFPFNDENGKPVERPKSEWIRTKLFPENKDRQGVVAHVGSPMKGEECHLKPGDRIIYKNALKSLITIEGKKYIILRQDRIHAKLL